MADLFIAISVAVAPMAIVLFWARLLLASYPANRKEKKQ